MRRRHAHHALLLATLFVAPTLIGASCEPVDLGHDTDAGTSVSDAGPGPSDAGPSPTDAGPAAGEPTVYGSPVLIDVFDGAESYVSFDFEARVPAAEGAPAHDVRPARLELLAADDTVLFTFPLDPAPLTTLDYDSTRGAQRYARFVTATVPEVPAVLATRCANDTYSGRLHHPGYRVVGTVDGVEVSALHRWPAGSGGFPPARPMVLCHQGVRIERHYEGFHNGFLGLFRRPDGRFDAELWESVGGATYTATSPIRSVDGDVRISPRSEMIWPSRFVTFTVAMDHFPCGGGGDCVSGGLMNRWLVDRTDAPLQLPGDSMTYWCEEPEAGAHDVYGGETWVPASAAGSSTPWGCRVGTGGDGAGVVRFSGTSDAGPMHVELFMHGAQWYYDETSLP